MAQGPAPAPKDLPIPVCLAALLLMFQHFCRFLYNEEFPWGRRGEARDPLGLRLPSQSPAPAPCGFPGTPTPEFPQ